MGTLKRRFRTVLLSCAWLLALLASGYVVSQFRFWTGMPSPSINYIAKLNEPTSNATDDQIAWPIYERAIVGFSFDGNPQSPHDSPLPATRPSDEKWQEMANWLKAHEPEFALVRQASTRPLLGYTYDVYQQGSGLQGPASASAPVISVLLTYIHPLNQTAYAILAETLLARSQKDIPRILANVSTLVGIARHAQGPCLVERLAAIRIREVALDAVEVALADPGLALTEVDLAALAALIAKPETIADLLNFHGERMFVEDMIQRIYTDNGNGDGRFTAEGMRFIQMVGGPTQAAGQRRRAAAILFPFAMASRQQVLTVYNEIMDLAEANLQRPYRDADWDRYRTHVEGIVTSFRYPPLPELLPSLDYAPQSAERYLGRREGIVVGIALRRYQLKHGSLPASLDATVPDYLPAIPRDRISGEPIRYRIIDGSPVVYSVGADLKDDGGSPPLDAGGQTNNAAAAAWGPLTPRARPGDWILYPTPQHAEK